MPWDNIGSQKCNFGITKIQEAPILAIAPYSWITFSRFICTRGGVGVGGERIAPETEIERTYGFERELKAVKDGWVRKNWSVIKNTRCEKKDTATIFNFELCHGISVEPTILGPRWFRDRPQNWKLWPCLFFVTPHLLWIFSSIFTRLWQPITLV